ncbi:uncharacterized protein G2W53_034103 [Senna tora]|uniref:Uncharacterized protein n=1 Tax=Senna tora TaxID=362788 RepID=A0A834W8L1_9FABA|nr:uncharacterized protein G2W53_034103 [Senna tora]
MAEKRLRWVQQPIWVPSLLVCNVAASQYSCQL